MTSDLGTVRTGDGTAVLRYERALAHPVDEVWAAVTDPAQMVGWWAEADIDLTLGGKVELRWLNTDDEGNATTARGTVTALEPPNLVEYDTDLHGRLRWELAARPGGCLLTFTCTIGVPPEHLTKHMAGWHIHLDHLVDALDGRPVDWPRWYAEHFPAWQALHERYEVVRRTA